MNGVGVRVDVNEELKFLEEFKKKNIFFLGGGGESGTGSGRRGGSRERGGGQGGCEVGVRLVVGGSGWM